MKPAGWTLEFDVGHPKSTVIGELLLDDPSPFFLLHDVEAMARKGRLVQWRLQDTSTRNCPLRNVYPVCVEKAFLPTLFGRRAAYCDYCTRHSLARLKGWVDTRAWLVKIDTG